MKDTKQSVVELQTAQQPVALPRIAIVHDYLTQRGGAERVVLAILRAFPTARIITSVYDASSTYPEFQDERVETSALQHIRTFRKDPRLALPVLPMAFGRMIVRNVDAVICSSSGWAHGIRTDAPKLVYCHNPARWLYQDKDYGRHSANQRTSSFKGLMPLLRRWDRSAAMSADRYLVNSTIVQKRVQRVYGIQAGLLPPPVTIDVTGAQEALPGVQPGYFLVVSRARGYKNVQAVCKAFDRLSNERLVVVGGLPDREDGGAWTSNLLGVEGVPDRTMRWLYKNCRAVIATSNEDFGLTPLEGNAFGRPALVIRGGGFLDTLVDGVTGHFIDRLDPESVVETIQRLLDSRLNSEAIAAHARNYSLESSVEKIQREVSHLIRGKESSQRALSLPGQA